jgi:hypothetical protein
VQAVDDRTHAGRACELNVLAAQRSVQDGEASRFDMAQHGGNLAPVRHEEVAGPRISQDRNDGIDPKPVGIGLDRGSGGGRARQAIERAPVRRQRLSVNPQPQGLGSEHGAIYSPAGGAACHRRSAGRYRSGSCR